MLAPGYAPLLDLGALLGGSDMLDLDALAGCPPGLF